VDIPIEKKKATPKKIGIIAAGALLLALFIYLLAFASNDPELKLERKRLSIKPIIFGAFQENIPVNGVVLPLKTIYLDVVEGGRVEERLVEDGAILKQGDPIIRLSNTDLELSLVNHETAVYNLLTQMQRTQNASRENTINKLNQLTEVKSSLKEAKRIFDLNKKLFEKGAIGKQDYLKSQNDYLYQADRLQLSEAVLAQDSLSTNQESTQMRESYERTRRALDLMKKKVEDLVVRAPVAGQITDLDAELGQSKQKGERLGQIDVISGYKVRAEIDEYYINRVFPGQLASFEFNGRQFDLEIKKVFTQVSNGRFQVDMLFTGDIPENIRRGQSLQIRLALSQEKQTLLVSKGAFFQQTGGNWIYKLSEDGETAFKTPIRLGSQNTQYYEVLEGLKEGDQVITSSYANYKQYDHLNLN
jgi:HlyD family secretion protein